MSPRRNSVWVAAWKNFGDDACSDTAATATIATITAGLKARTRPVTTLKTLAIPLARLQASSGEARSPPSFADISDELRRDLAEALVEAGSAKGAKAAGLAGTCASGSCP